MTQLFEKQGRRYVPWGHLETHYRHGEVMRVGTFRLIYCPEPGLRRYRHDVVPDTAAFLAAAEIARKAMEDALVEASRCRHSPRGEPLTKEQQAVVEECRQKMEAAGILVPVFWTHGSAHEVAEAGIEAVRRASGLEGIALPLPEAMP